MSILPAPTGAPGPLHVPAPAQGLAILLLSLQWGCLPAPSASAPPPAPAPLVPVAAAPALPLTVAARLRRYVDGQLDNFLARRADRMGQALEPQEKGIVAKNENMHLHRQLSRIEAHFNAGEELFEQPFLRGEGMGSGIGGKAPAMHRVHRGAHGGPDSATCIVCHHRGGDDGAGEYSQNALTGGDGESAYHANERNAPALLGGGAVQVLAAEISAALGKIAQPAEGMETTVHLVYQGVDFGAVRFGKDGRMDASALRAIDPDLVVRPFGWKGTHSHLRRFAEEAFQVHHGMQSEVLVAARRQPGVLPRGAGPATLALLNGLGDGPPEDPDRDGVFLELAGGFLTSISVYLALLPLPVIDPPKAPDLAAAFRDGEAAFREVGCAECHKEKWDIVTPTWTEHSEGSADPEEVTLDLRKDMQRGDSLENTDVTIGTWPIFLFSDLRRHDMGPGLSDPAEGGGPHKRSERPAGPQIAPSYFLTRPLWGLADSAPYLHDGRALTVPDAILAHGGEAQASRDAYAALPVARQRAVHVFLLSLARPPVPQVVP